MKRPHKAKQNSRAYLTPEIRSLIDNPTDTIVVGMSGIGKSWLTSRIATEGRWRRISIDSEIQSRYLREEINTTFLSEIADRPMLSRMHAAGALAIDWELYVDTLEPLSAWLGMPGDKSRGGLAFKQYERRQNAHYEAERRALEDLLLHKRDPDQPLLVDTSGSFCEVLSLDDKLFERLAERFKFVSLRETDALMALLISRFRKNPKPIFYPRELLVTFWNSYVAEKNVSETTVPPPDFANWAYEKLIEKRREKYARIADNLGIAIDADRLQDYQKNL